MALRNRYLTIAITFSEMFPGSVGWNADLESSFFEVEVGFLGRIGAWLQGFWHLAGFIVLFSQESGD